MSIHKGWLQIGVKLAGLLAVLTLIAAGFSQFASTQVIANNAPRIPANAQSLGPEVASKKIAVTVWLRQRNKAELDELVRQMYQKGSPNYHRWLTPEQYHTRFAPTVQEAATVSSFLTAHGLKILSVDKNNHFVTAQGRVADVQNAFRVQINRFRLNGETHRTNLSAPLIEGAAGALVASVQGLSDRVYKPHSRRPIDPDSGKPFPGIPLASVSGPNGLFFSSNCLRPAQNKTFKTPGGGPHATYHGNRYGAQITNMNPPNLPPCGYGSSDIQKAYGLKALHKAGWDGAGQTIVIVDAFGSPTIRKDANTFSQINGLPALTQANFHILRVGVPTGCKPADGCDPADWIAETTLDVEWAHAVAPKANILLIATKDNTFTNLDLGVFLAASNLLGSVISNSYGGPEVLFPAEELVVEDSNNQLAAVLGMSANFSSGDSGDFGPASQGAFTSAAAPASSPFATAVGGTSLFLNFTKTIKRQTGWGTNETRIADVTPNPPSVPPINFGFIFGAGGGPSSFFAKPSYQSSLPGDVRMVPDIAYVSDPFTGVEIVITDAAAGGQVVEVIGGTSLACPMFSALWAIANQAAGVPLGQAAPLLYDLPASAITDVIDETSPNNVAGTIFDPPNPPINESADDLAGPLQNTVNYVSALYNSPFSTRWFVLTFGTDSGLTTSTGWDNVTGLGTPNGLAFVNAVKAAATANAARPQ